MATDLSASAHPIGPASAQTRGGSMLFWAVKRLGDILISLLALPLVGLIAVVVLALNPFYNKGPLFFAQPRMGIGQRPFTAHKFRTMAPVARITRKANDPVERHRITRLGLLMRKTRIDELPQFINILKGEMSLIGPRPDFIDHANVFLSEIPEYQHRYTVRPGLSGLAQVTLGYVEGVEETRFKAQADLSYIRNASLLLDLRIFWLTLRTVVTATGH